MTDVFTDVLTLRLDEPTQARFDRLRTVHFPPERNLIAAHLTLFHTLPEEAWVRTHLLKAAEATPRFPLAVTGLRSLGRGVAYTLTSPELMDLHRRLAQAFAEVLSPQDRQPFQPHIVVQNKATPDAARALLANLRATFTPSPAEAIGLDLWRYRGGPWEYRETFLFP